MRLRFLALLFILMFLLGCAAPSDPLAYQREGGDYLLTGRVDGVVFSAELSLPPIDDTISLDARPFTLTYTSPDALAGITLIGSSEGVTLTRGSVVDAITDDRYGGLLCPAALFCIDCPMGAAAVVEQNSTVLNRVTAADDEGRYTVWLDEEGLPRRIEAVLGGREAAVDVRPTR